MSFIKVLDIFYNSICNEIDTDENVLKRIDKKLDFIPVRHLKSIRYIDKFHINKFIYSFFCIISFFLFPIYFLFKIRFNFKSKYLFHNKKINMVLVADNRIESLYKNIDVVNNSEIVFININQPNKDHYIDINSFVSLEKIIKSYIYSIVSLFYIIFKLNRKTDFLQVYVAYDWFKTYFVLEELVNYSNNVYFSNHYDRWSTMFDFLFKKNNLVLIQHGILPNDLTLTYKLKNLNTIYYLDEKSKKIFLQLFECTRTNFKTINLKLNLTPVECDKKTILIIGQPHSMEKELEIINLIKDKYLVYVKPHPLYDYSKYKVSNIELILDKDFFPKVDIALSYESTLGLEYEISGINVLWWKELSFVEIINEINKRLN
ncbi:hypothetical protein ACOL3J_02005 [Aliarcobacter butzleri]